MTCPSSHARTTRLTRTRTWITGLTLTTLLVGCASGPSNVLVQLTPYAPPAPTAATGTRGAVFVEPVRDARRDAVGRLIGQRTTIGGISMGMVEVNPTPTAVTGSVLQSELRGLGFDIATAASPVRLSARLTRFEIQTPATALYWDINGAVDIELSASRADGRQQAAAYQTRCTDRTYAWPGEDLIAKVLDGCLRELGSRVRADGELLRFLGTP